MLSNPCTAPTLQHPRHMHNPPCENLCRDLGVADSLILQCSSAAGGSHARPNRLLALLQPRQAHKLTEVKCITHLAQLVKGLQLSRLAKVSMQLCSERQPRQVKHRGPITLKASAQSDSSQKHNKPCGTCQGTPA